MGGNNIDLRNFISDQPSNEDHLDFGPYVEALSDLISSPDTETPLSIGLFGSWGSGKTTLINLVKRSLPKGQFVTIDFDAWKYNREDAIWRVLLLRVLDSLRPSENNRTEKANQLRVDLDRLEESLYGEVEWTEKGSLSIDWPQLIKSVGGGALKLSFAFIPGLSAITKAVEAAQEAVGKGEVSQDFSDLVKSFKREVVNHRQAQLKHIEEFQEKFAELVETHFYKEQRKLIIFVDDLDRCLPPKSIEVLEAIKLFLDVKGCIFVIALDQDVVTQGLHIALKELLPENKASIAISGEKYLERIIQLPFLLPLIETKDIRNYVNSFSANWPHDGCIDIFIEGLPPNPRHIKRCVNVFLFLWRLTIRKKLERTITPLRLAKVVVIQTAYPAAFNILKSNSLLLKDLEGYYTKSTHFENGNRDSLELQELLGNYSKMGPIFQIFQDNSDARFSELNNEELAMFFSLAWRFPVVVEKENSRANLPSSDNDKLQSDTGFYNRVPSLPSLIIGRNEDIQKIKARLGIHRKVKTSSPQMRLIVIQGLPGVGKSTLMSALAHDSEILNAFPDGVLWASLGQEPNILDELKVWVKLIEDNSFQNLQSVDEIKNRLSSALQNKRVLFLLDDVWEPNHALPFLVGGRNSATVITTRSNNVARSIAPAAADIYTLEVLRIEDSITLLRVLAPSFVSQFPDESSVLVLELGCLPLSLQVIGHFINANPNINVENLITDIKQGVRILDLNAPIDRVDQSFETLPTISVLLQQSIDQLDMTSKKYFAALGVFEPKPSTFSLEALSEVCNEGEIQKGIRELVDYGLIESVENRFQIHPLMQKYALSLLERSEDKDELHRKRFSHAKFYADILFKANDLYLKGGEEIISGIKILDIEWKNINSGHQWAENSFIDNKVAGELCIYYPDAGKDCLDLRLSPNEKVHWLQVGLEAARFLVDKNFEISMLGNLGNAFKNIGNFQSAIQQYEQALALMKENNLVEYSAAVLTNLGIIYADIGNLSLAQEVTEKAYTVVSERGDKRLLGSVLINIASIQGKLGDFEKAISSYREALELIREIGDKRSESVVLNNLGITYSNIGETQWAVVAYQQALEIAQAIGDRRTEASVYASLGNVSLSSDDVQHAEDFYEKARNKFHELNDLYNESIVLGNLGNVYLLENKNGQALELFEQQLKYSQEIGNSNGSGNALGNVGLVYLEIGDYNQALDYFKKQLEICKKHGFKRGEANALWNSSLALYSLGKHLDAVTFAVESLQIFEELGDPISERIKEKLSEWQQADPKAAEGVVNE